MECKNYDDYNNTAIGKRGVLVKKQIIDLGDDEDDSEDFGHLAQRAATRNDDEVNLRTDDTDGSSSSGRIQHQLIEYDINSDYTKSTNAAAATRAKRMAVQGGMKVYQGFPDHTSKAIVDR